MLTYRSERVDNMSAKALKYRIIFVNYGAFRSNSGGHIANFANQLNKLGCQVAVCASGEVSDPENGLDPGVHAFSHEDLLAAPEAVLNCGSVCGATLVHAWTPREGVVKFCKALCANGNTPYFVHLEDNEEVVSAKNLGLDLGGIKDINETHLPDPFPDSLSHPTRYRDFLGKANGVSTIVTRLQEFVPDHVPRMLLEPGVDTTLFMDRLTAEQKAKCKSELGISPLSSVVVYPGNMHAANDREIFSLYTALAILERRGWDVSLIRTGKDYTTGIDLAYERFLQSRAINLGYVAESRLIELLSLADFYVQPGASNVFNDYRFPSKLPEFLAMGKPTLLPNTNVGERLRDGQDALLLKRGDGVEIADCVERILKDKKFASKLGRNSRKFAKSSLNWFRNTENLLRFYDENLTKRPSRVG